MPFLIPSRTQFYTPLIHLNSSAFKKIMISMVSVSPPHIIPLNQFHSHPETETLISSLEKCNSMEQLRQIYSQTIIKGLGSNPIVQSKIIAFCCSQESGNMNYARYLFDRIPKPDIFIWNTMIKGFSRIKWPKYAVSMYIDMLENNIKPDHYTFPFLLKGFTSDVAFECGKGVHVHVCKFGFESDLFIQNALIHMYCLCGQIDIARDVFDMSSKIDVITWNALISRYNKMKQYEESKKLFEIMAEKGVIPNSVTLVSVLSACSKLKDVDTGKKVNQSLGDYKIELNLILANALIDLYAACGDMNVALGIFGSMKERDVISWTTIVKGFVNSGQISLAREYFHQMPERDIVSWTTMIDGYQKENQFKEVLVLFREMQTAKVKPDEFVMVSVLTACAHLGALELGEWIKAYIEKNKIKNDVYVGNALIDMYFKCGKVEKAQRVFDEMEGKDRFTWTAMIVGLAINGQGNEALHMFFKMLRASVTPDEITYVGVLSACSHAGMVDEGRKFFAGMTTEHGIEPNMTHYGCMVDLLGRAGNLKEAYEVIQKMTMKPNSVVWGALLGACRVYKDVEMAETAAKQILQLEPNDGAVYVLLCNIYAACNRWEDLREVRKTMMERGIKKTPGCSLIEMNGTLHEFVAGDKSHPQTEKIYSKLEEMTQRLKFEGYLPNTSEVFLDVRKEEKEDAVNQHSEKLAMAFALISSESRVVIRIVKNLRMCVDCHHVAKLVSRIYSREIIVRDRTRFHHFRDGVCSCKDFW